MHNCMRMYRGKKILKWSKTPEEAYETMLYLNNEYFMGGRRPNSYANFAPTSARMTGAERNERSSARSTTRQRAA